MQKLIVSSSPPRWASRAVLTGVLTLMPLFPLRAATLPIPPDWRFTGKEKAALKVDVNQVLYDGAFAPAVKVTAEDLSKLARVNAISQVFNKAVFNINLATQGKLTFKAKFEGTGGAAAPLRVQLVGPQLNLAQTFAADAGTPAKDGYREYTWEISPLVLPAGRSGNALTEMRLSVAPAAGATGGQTVTVIDFAFHGEPRQNPRAVPLPTWKEDGTPKARNLPLTGWKIESPEGVESGVKVENVSVPLAGKPAQALRITYTKPGALPRRQKFGTVYLPMELNADKENVFTFKAKVEAPEGTKQLRDVEAPLTGWYSYQFNEYTDNFGVGMADKFGFDWTANGVPRTHFLQHLDKSVPVTDGFKTFRWDVKNENPTGNKGFDLENVSALQFFYDNRKLKEGQKTVITILSPQLVSGTRKTGGDEEEFAKFQQYINSYKPDYSDSTKYLGAPEKGRLPAPLPLVKNGQAVGEIVGNSNIWNPEGNGVNELYSWLYRLTDGIAIPVVPKATETDNVKIFVGQTLAKEHFAQDIEALKGSDGCAIRTRGKNVYIFGGTSKGTLNGVYTFLEGNSDIIWPMPSKIYEAIYSTSPNLSIVWGDYLHRAPARYWGWMGKTEGPTFDYQLRNRANYLGLRSGVHFKYWGLYMEEGGGHNLHSWIPWSLWKTHPEYWAFINGERRHPDAYKNQICLSNEDGKTIFTNRILDLIDKNPHMKTANCFNIKIEDNWGVCECPDCTRPIRLADGTLLDKDDISYRSTQFTMFLNSVANRIHNSGYPRLAIGTYIYFYTVPVPKIAPTDYLRPYFCDYVRKDNKVPLYAPINEIWWRILNDWTAISDRVVIREYTGLYVPYRSLAEVAKFDIRSQLKAGAVEFTSESLHEASSDSPKSNKEMDVSAMEFWVISRLYWDPEADVEQLRKYFLRRTYRNAAPEMEKFFGILRMVYFGEKRTSDFEENQETLRAAMRQGKEEELRSLLKAAQAKENHPLSRQLVNLAVRHFDDLTAKVKAETK